MRVRLTMLCDQLRAQCEGLGWFTMRRAIRWGMVHKERVLNVEIVQGADCALWRLCIAQCARCNVHCGGQAQDVTQGGTAGSRGSCRA